MSGSVIAFFVIVILVIAFFVWLYEESLVAFIVVWSLIGAAVIFAIVYALCKHFIGAARERKKYRSRQSAPSAKPQDEDILQFITPVIPPAPPAEQPKPLVYRMPSAPEPEENGLQVAAEAPAAPSGTGEQDLKPVADTAPITAAPVPHSPYPYTYAEDAGEASADWVDDAYMDTEEEDDMDMDEDDWDEDGDWDEDEDLDDIDLDEDEEDGDEEDYDILDEDEDEDDILQDEYVREKRKKDLQDYYYYYDPDLKIL